MAEVPLHVWVSGNLPMGVGQVLDRLRCTEGVRHIAVMPDVHVASEFCVGTVIASDQYFFPNAVGGDIGCGMLAMEFDGDADVLADAEKAARILGLFCQVCPARRHHRRTAHSLPEALRELGLSDGHLESQRHSEDLRTQLGTLGAGNHFLEMQLDELTGALWLMLHTGSRHLGQMVFRYHLARARRLGSQVLAIQADSAEGRAYFRDVQSARAWAKENRRMLAVRAAEAVERILRVSPMPGTLIDCDHNHLQRENHVLDGKPAALWVHRKGASAAKADQPGLIPGSMATRSFHTRGRGNAASLASSSHGAGRALSRTRARQKITRGRMRQQLRDVYYDARIERALLEEAPGAYKDIDEVMRAQEELTTITRRLRPLLIYKGT
jgi:tRNA-splicing ligase RtcB (3'-phosphate/5'-hydroxy nucleic acid ligase)